MPHHALAAEKRGTCHGLNLFVCAIFARNPGFDNLQANIAVGRQSHQDAAPAFERGPIRLIKQAQALRPFFEDTQFRRRADRTQERQRK